MRFLTRCCSWRLLPLVLFFLLLAFLWRGLSLDPHQLPSAMIAKPLPDFQWPVLASHAPSLTPKSMRGQVVLLNVWASWCSTCAEEHVFLMKLAHQGVMIYGLNYKDELDAARGWLREWGNPYVAVGVDLTGHDAMKLGVYGTPETFLIDARGIVRYRHTGPLNEVVWQSEFLPKIKQLTKGTS